MSDPLDDKLFSTHPNDAFFKGVFSDPVCAAEFFQSHLPAPVAACIDWRTLLPLPASFVKQDLQQSHSDLLYSARCGSREVLLYLVFEHQTTVDARMPLRLLNYMTQIWLGHAENHGLPLPVVLPFVLHQGPDRWTVSPRFEEMFDLPPDVGGHLLPFVPKFNHALLDLSQCDPAREEDHAKMRVILHLMKTAREKQLMEFFRWLGQAGPDVTLVLDGRLFRLCLVYAWNADATLDVEQISRHLTREPRLQTEAMTTAQQLRLEGRQEGRQEGRWIGRLQLLQEMLGLPLTQTAELESLGITELERRFRLLDEQYKAQFKK